MEVECLGACVNAPMLQIGSDFYEDIDGPITEQMIADLRAGKAQARVTKKEDRANTHVWILARR